MARNAPRTPIRNSALLLQDSPFSDYFTDDAGSFDNRSPYSAPSPSAQRLLVRLHTLGAEILRQDPSEHTTHDISTKLDILEATLHAPVAQTRQPAHLADSGLFLEDDHDGDYDTEGTPSTHSLQNSQESHVHEVNDTPILMRRATNTSATTKLPAPDHLLKNAQEVLERVENANRSLRQRYHDMCQLNQSHMDELEESAQEVLRLKSENESLKADLGFDHSELLFMKLQLKALEVQIDTFPEAEHASDIRKKVLLNDDIDRWKADWDDVDARLRSRRGVHKVVSTTPTKLAGARDEGKQRSDDQGLWRLDMCKRTHGRVQSITIKRFDSQNAEGDDDDEQTLVDGDLNASRKTSYSEQSTQTDASSPDVTSEEDAAAGDEGQAPHEPSVPEEKTQYCEQATQTETTVIELDGEEDAAVGTEFLGAMHDLPEKPQYCEQAVQTDALQIADVSEAAEQDDQDILSPPKNSFAQSDNTSYSEQATQTEAPVVNEEDLSRQVSADAHYLSQDLVTVSEKLQYSDQATQTDLTNLLITYDVEDDNSDNEQEDEVENEDEAILPKRTAWQELCESLSAFAGMDKE